MIICLIHAADNSEDGNLPSENIPDSHLMVKIPSEEVDATGPQETAEGKSEDLRRSTDTKAVRRNKWKPEEIKILIKKRSEMDEKFRRVKARMVLWEEISADLLAHGVDRSPAQCKSLWSSLVQKYEVSDN